MVNEKKTSLGIPENVEALLAYVLGWITGIVFLVIEKESKFVRFHAMQSLLFFLGLMIVNMIFGIIPLLGWLVDIILTIVGLVYWILGMVKAFKGEYYHFPFVGKYAEEWTKK